MNIPALLALEDGSKFYGRSFGAPGMGVGEVVFNTSMTGYQEILTDPSYCRQLVTLTYPHIGSVGVNSEDVESNRVYASGLIVKNVPYRFSSWRAEESLPDYLNRRGVVAICDIDTRKLTRTIRDKGALRGCILAGESMDDAGALKAVDSFPGLAGMDLVKEVTVGKSYRWKHSAWKLGSGYRHLKSFRYSITAYDFGIKYNILRILAEKGCDITVVPAVTSAEAVLKQDPDGVFLSNGPGDPEPCSYAVEAIREIMNAKIPIFGICLGHQLLCLASGAKTEKMKFGHHGANHPVRDIASNQVLITSQNHGFTVNEESLGENIAITHRSLFDNTVQGVRRTDVPAFSFQGHPEASPGPGDVGCLFDRFINMMALRKSGRADA